jgi:hypothetical protein
MKDRSELHAQFRAFRERYEVLSANVREERFELRVPWLHRFALDFRSR